VPIYALKVQTGKEEQVVSQIRDRLGTIPDVARVINPQNSQKRPLFPGYVFIESEREQLNPETYYKVLESDFAHYFLCPKSGVQALAPSEDNVLQDQGPIAAGAAVSIIRGKFKGLTGTLQNITDSSATVEVMVFGQIISLEVSTSSIRLIEPE
jgi:transcription antitermination factor NusG